MTKSLANRLYLKQALYSFKMQEEKSIEEQMNDFNKIIMFEIFLITILGKNKSHVLQQQNSLSQLLYHNLVHQVV